jgi:hypothetical protein
MDRIIPLMTEVDIRQIKPPYSRTFVNRFNVQDNVVNHENIIEIEQNYNQNQAISVNSYFMHAEGDQLTKVTELYLQGQVVKIIDTYASVSGFQPVQTEVTSVRNKRERR